MMAVFVSRFGCFMSTTSPHLKRESSLFSNPCKSLGGASLVMKICFPFWCSMLNMWKNISCVFSFLLRNWMSSMTKMSSVPYSSMIVWGLFSSIFWMNNVVNFSAVM